MTARIYLTGEIAFESGDLVLTERQFPSPQVRLLVAYFVWSRRQAVSASEIAEVLWPSERPKAWENALKSLVSKTRRELSRVIQRDAEELVVFHYGCYRLELPSETWIDIEYARSRMDEAEGRIRSKDYVAAWGPTNAALIITARPFLQGEPSPWAERCRVTLRQLRLRALDAYGAVHLSADQPRLAEAAAREALALEPYHEGAYRTLMRAFDGMGNRGQAIRAFHDCRALLRQELGVEPSEETLLCFETLLRR